MSEKPAPGSKLKYLMPNGVVVASTAVPPTDSSVRSAYMLGFAVDQSAGLLTFTVTVADWAWPAGTLTVAVPCPAGRPRGSVIVSATSTVAAVLPSLATSVWTCTAAYPDCRLASRSGVVTKVPCRATCTGAVTTR